MEKIQLMQTTPILLFSSNLLNIYLFKLKNNPFENKYFFYFFFKSK